MDYGTHICKAQGSVVPAKRPDHEGSNVDACRDDDCVHYEEHSHGRDQARLGLVDPGVHYGDGGEYSTEAFVERGLRVCKRLWDD